MADKTFGPDEIGNLANDKNHISSMAQQTLYIRMDDDIMNTPPVNIETLAEFLGASKETIYKTWRTYPHFFITGCQTARSARFDLDDVVLYLKGRDYNASIQRTLQIMGRPGANNRVARKVKVRVQNEGGGRKVGNQDKRNDDESGDDPFNLRSGLY